MRTMKDSGIEWIGAIPDNWTVGKTLYGLRMPITDGPHETPVLFEEGIPFVSAEAISSSNGHIDFEHIRGFVSEDYYKECCKKYIPKLHDIYMIKSGATTGRVALVETDRVFTIWSPLAVFRCDESKCHYRFLFYFLQSDAYQKQVENMWSFGTQQNIGMRTLEKNAICFPSLNEQQKIADYLDEKNHEIDELIAKKEKTNELLKERRQSIIYEAVTKGLNPDASMKDSGIEWIGQIPEKWTVWRMKHLADEPLQYGANATGVEFDEMLPRYVRITDITSDRKLADDGKQSLPIETAKDYMLQDGDILLARSGATAGKSYYYETSDGACCFAGYLIRFRANKAKANSKFLYYYTLTQPYEQWTQQIFIQATIQNISAEKYNNLCFAIPDTLEEQKRIVEYLDEKCAEIDSIITINNKAIQQLKEYRQSLIYEAVTGKKEV